MTNAIDYSACWASCLGDCAEGMSYEHLFSECLFPTGDIMVQGFSWCKETPKPMRIERLKKRMLCRRHNGRLSELDSASKQSVLTLMDSHDLFMTRDALSQRRWAVKTFHVDMLLLERWCVKTLINMNHLHGWQIGDNACNPCKPTPELVEVAYGLRKFTGRKGLYIPGTAGDKLTPRQGATRFTAVTVAGENRLAGGKFLLWGFPFWLSIVDDAIENPHNIMKGNTRYGFKV